MDARQGDFIQVHSGRAFFPFDPRDEDFDIEDIAHSLSLLCRFAGHCRTMYSVGEHSIRVSIAAEDLATKAGADPETSRRVALAGLLHDAVEAYLNDIPRPIKALPEMEAYRRYHDELQKAIYEHFDASLPMAHRGFIKAADDILLATEKRDLMAHPERAWHPLPDPLPDPIAPWEPPHVYWLFMRRFKKYGGTR